MEWNERLQIIIDYVEHHLQREEEPLDNREISNMAGCSLDFFHKVFSYMNGISFSEYVRFRKLTLAGYDVKSTDKKILEISDTYGYQSPTSFTKAFQQFHGISPKEAREQNKELQVMPKMQIAYKQQYSWRIEQKTTFRLIGKCIKLSCANHELDTSIPEIWSECQKNGVYSTLISLDTSDTKGLFGVFLSCDAYLNQIEYGIMVISDKILPSEFIEMVIPNTTWVVFDCRGRVPQSIHKGWNYLHEEWLIKYPFKHAPYPEMEWYRDANVYSEDYVSQIWIPILEKEES